ncbi:MAG TPA: hypothetical protein VMF59_05695, partial [Bacteroidota bacterium]|nr:hypothetical protein [Bacteroidota bacterium]
VMVNVLPVQIGGSLAFDFGRSELGAAFIVNTSNILTYTAAPAALFNEESRGVVSKTIIKKIAFQVFYGF